MSELCKSAPEPTNREPTRPGQQEEEAPQTKYDNFYTPRNHDFYSKFQYADLNPKERRIRLLRIHPPIPADNTRAMVQCDFLGSILMEDMTGKYTTISYCAGDPKKTEIILVDGHEFNAFANLGHALRQARYFWKDKFEERELFLWVDQVCIDQSNSVERTHQVEMMGDVYASAEQVLICLSTEGDPAGGIAWMHSVLQDLSLIKGSIYADAAHERVTDRSVGGPFLSKYQLVPYLKWNEMDFHLGFDTFLKTILRSAWWSRVWVQQEFVRSREAFFTAAFEAIQWNAVAQFMEFYWTIHNLDFQPPDFHCESAQETEVPSDCQACVFTREPQSLWRSSRRADGLLKLKERIESKGGQFPNMLDHLKEAYFYESSDPRDIIYARLGISERYKDIVPDYSPEVSIQHVLTQWTVDVISADSSLAIIEWGHLTRFKILDLALPSWVPDWRRGPTSGHLKEVLYPPVSKSSISFAPDCNGRKNCILQVKGVFYGILEPNGLPERYAAYQYFTAVEGKQVMIMGRWAKVGDQVWLLHGYNNFLVLRPKEECYELIGDIYCEDGMLPQVPALLQGLASMVEAGNPLVQTVKIC